MRWGTILHPTQRVIRQILGNSPLMNLMTKHSHYILGCNNGIQKYVNNLRFSGFNCVNISIPVTENKKFCKLCPIIKSILNKNNPAKLLADKFLRGPDDFISHTLSKSPLDCLQLDEIGPLFLGNRNGFTKIWVLIGVEIVTHLIHLVPMQAQNTISFISSLDILRARRGCMATIVIDAH